MSGDTRLATLVGDIASPGLHWIIVGDGFTASELPTLRDAALRLADELLDTPELAAHTSVWNVHLLEAASRESGVDDPARGVFLRTAFDGSLGCGSNARIACVDWSRINAALAGHAAPLGPITVILNTTEYVGSSNTSGIIVSRNEHAPRITVHELGHRVAGLADEYVDAAVAAEWLPLYVEGRYPNVTRTREASAAPWRHWVADGASGVGLYEGAFYAATGFYRPKQDSLMRTLEAPLGEVNAEAWLRAQYRALPPLATASPAATQVQGIAGSLVSFEAASPWPRAAVTLRWYIDGVEVPAARDRSRFEFQADGAEHTVEVRASDASGRIRAPDATEARATRTWRVSPSAVAVSTKVDQTAKPATFLRVRIDAVEHSVVGWEPARPGTSFADSDAEDWRYALLDDDGRVLASGVAADPRVVRSTLAAPGEPHTGHTVAVLDAGEYRVAVPEGLAPKTLRIAPTIRGAEKLGSSGEMREALVEIGLDPP